jgi:hypothetical protein
MDPALATTIVSTSGPVITSVLGMFIMVNQVGRRIDNMNKRLGERIDNLRASALDTEIAKLMDRRNPQ